MKRRRTFSHEQAYECPDSYHVEQACVSGRQRSRPAVWSWVKQQGPWPRPGRWHRLFDKAQNDWVTRKVEHR